MTEMQSITRAALLRELNDRQIDTFRLDRDDYAPVPWGQLRRAVMTADGAVVLGFRQLHVTLGEWRPGTSEARTPAAWYPTPWTQIEAGMAVMAEVPVLVVADAEVSDGVFAPDVWGGRVFGLPAGADETARREVLDAWAAAVSARVLRRTGDGD